MKRIALLMLLAPALAHADERTTVITVSGMLGAIEPEHPTDLYMQEPDPLVGPRLTLSWENAPIAYPPTRGYAFDTALVPELVGGAFIDDVRAQGFIGAGVRAELKMAQREMGLLRISARGGFYLVGRGIVVGDNRKPYGEVGLGEYFLIGQAGRIGFEFTAVFTSREQMTAYDEDNMRSGGVAQVYFGWRP